MKRSAATPTKCSNDHPLTAQNTYTRGKYRSCKTCRAEAMRRHRERRRAAGMPLHPVPQVDTAEDRLAARVTPTAAGCWEWQGRRDRDGYGRMFFQGIPEATHRVAYLLHVGPIPPGLEVDHLCNNRACVRPDHLEAVTHAENVRRANERRRSA